MKRAKRTNEKIKTEIAKAIKDAARGSTYGPGVALEANERIHPEIIKMEESKKKNKSQMCPFPGCMGKNHKSTKSKHCKYYGCTDPEKLDEAILSYLVENYPDYYNGEIDGFFYNVIVVRFAGRCFFDGINISFRFPFFYFYLRAIEKFIILESSVQICHASCYVIISTKI